MASLAGNLTAVGNSLDCSLFFARQPEPDLEFTEEELDQTAATKPATPTKQPKKSGGGRPLLWVLLLLLIGGIGYVAMEPEQLTVWLAPLLGDSTPKQTVPPVATAPRPQQEDLPIPPPPAPATTDMAPAAPADPASMPPSSTMPQAASHQVPPMDAPASVSPGRATASPLFGEGQRVTVMGNPTAPGEMVQLTLDPAGAKAGPAIRPGATLSILDGDLQPSGWVYSVRSDDGVKGWVSEKRLRMKF
ncbi:conserved protein of unknown function [Nitrospira japonica]|uniref:Uncharacterized protein n=1 Tax=Nitrospira japonica TaxID=1325564 RepID=A0A1W1I7A3_9BACT|nr:SH3 domain-containing protein [Nitrospira japonica]SLM48801.1 conserved protein of unknown function [Nitrospira japonica]